MGSWPDQGRWYVHTSAGHLSEASRSGDKASSSGSCNPSHPRRLPIDPFPPTAQSRDNAASWVTWICLVRTLSSRMLHHLGRIINAFVSSSGELAQGICILELGTANPRCRRHSGHPRVAGSAYQTNYICIELVRYGNNLSSPDMGERRNHLHPAYLSFSRDCWPCFPLGRPESSSRYYWETKSVR
jgi:hypothetical protein